MSSINAKLGLKPAGTRAMMKLPTDRALRNRLTAAQCPTCARRGATLSRLRATAGMFVCTWCAHVWRPEE